MIRRYERFAHFTRFLLAATLLAGCSHKAPVTVENNASTAPEAAGGAVLVAAGTDFYGKLSQPIGTKVDKNGDSFTLVETDTFMHKGPAALQGSALTGHLENVQAAGFAHKPQMTIVFDGIRMPDGTLHPVDAELISMNRFEPKSHHLRTIGMMIGGAVVGHVAAARAGKKHGGLMGAAAGFALSQEMKTDIYVPAGTIVEVKLKSPVTANTTQ
jgi:hypothetical protein